MYNNVFEPSATVWATYFSMPFRDARVAELTRERALPAAEADALRLVEQSENEAGHDFLVAMNTTDASENDLESSHSIWRVALSADGGPQTLPQNVERLGRPDAQLRELFPYAGDFYVAYRVRFPIHFASGATLIPDDARILTLHLAGPRGRAELTWDRSRGR